MRGKEGKGGKKEKKRFVFISVSRASYIIPSSHHSCHPFFLSLLRIAALLTYSFIQHSLRTRVFSTPSPATGVANKLHKDSKSKLAAASGEKGTKSKSDEESSIHSSSGHSHQPVQGVNGNGTTERAGSPVSPGKLVSTFFVSFSDFAFLYSLPSPPRSYPTLTFTFLSLSPLRSSILRQRTDIHRPGYRVVNIRSSRPMSLIRWNGARRR
jgi:hypothetical protein